jgi:hypothetical protein
MIDFEPFEQEGREDREGLAASGLLPDLPVRILGGFFSDR